MNYLNRFLSSSMFLWFLLAVGAAHADTITGSSAGGDSFDLYVTTSPFSDGVSIVNSVSGTTTIHGVTQMVDAMIATSAPGTETYTADGFFYFDNLLYALPGNPFDGSGLAFTLQDGTEVNLFYNDSSPGSGLVYENNGYNSTIATVSAAATPEPAGLVLMGSGMLGIASVVRRRFNL